jgi:hypothetical protein
MRDEKGKKTQQVKLNNRKDVGEEESIRSTT